MKSFNNSQTSVATTRALNSRAPAPTPEHRAQLVSAFYNSPDDALFDQKTLAAVLSRTTAWAEMARWKGDGPKFIRVGKRSVLYRKREILQWLRQFAERETNELQAR